MLLQQPDAARIEQPAAVSVVSGQAQHDIIGQAQQFIQLLCADESGQGNSGGAGGRAPACRSRGAGSRRPRVPIAPTPMMPAAFAAQFRG